jgi:hypothetical protein
MGTASFDTKIEGPLGHIWIRGVQVYEDSSQDVLQVSWQIVLLELGEKFSQSYSKALPKMTLDSTLYEVTRATGLGSNEFVLPFDPRKDRIHSNVEQPRVSKESGIDLFPFRRLKQVRDWIEDGPDQQLLVQAVKAVQKRMGCGANEAEKALEDYAVWRNQRVAR